MPRKWLACISLLYILSSLILISIESLTLAKGIYRPYGINGLQIGLSAVFLITAMACLLLQCCKKWRRTQIFFTLLLAIASLVCSSILVSLSSPSLERLFMKHSLKNFVGFLDQTDGKYSFPLFPWTFLHVAKYLAAYWLIAASAILILICLDLTFSLRISLNQAKDNSHQALFKLSGTLLIICGVLTNICWLLMPLITYINSYWYLNTFAMPFACLSMYIGAGLVLSNVAAFKVERRACTFAFTLVILGSCIVALVFTASDIFNSYYYDGYNGCVTKNDTHLCINQCNTYYHDCKIPFHDIPCISSEQICNGQLDFLPDLGRNSSLYDSCRFYDSPVDDKMLYDEILFCKKERFIPVFALVFGSCGLCIILCFAIFFVTFPSILSLVKLAWQKLSQFFLSHELLQHSD